MKKLLDGELLVLDNHFRFIRKIYYFYLNFGSDYDFILTTSSWASGSNNCISFPFVLLGNNDIISYLNRKSCLVIYSYNFIIVFKV